MKTVVSIVLNNFTNDSRVLKEAISLSKNDFNVTVIALHENELPTEEIIDSLRVKRIKLFSRSYWSKNKMIQVLKYFQFLNKAIRFVQDKNIVHCNDLKALPVGVLAKLFLNKKIKVVYDAHEYETQMFGLSKVEQFFSFVLEKRLIKHADAVLTVSNSIALEYQKLYSIPKPTLIYNTPKFLSLKNEGDIQNENVFRKKFNIGENQKIFIYQGGLSKGRGIETILVSFEHLHFQSKNKSDLPVVIFMGNGVLSELIQKYSNICSNIFYHQAVEIEKVLSYTRNADCGINFLGNTCLNHYYCMPNKLFEYLMAELPLITSNLYDVKLFVEDNNVGQVSVTNDVYGLLDAIEKIIQKDKQILLDNIQKVKKRYNWEAQEIKLLEVYNNL